MGGILAVLRNVGNCECIYVAAVGIRAVYLVNSGTDVFSDLKVALCTTMESMDIIANVEGVRHL